MPRKITLMALALLVLPLVGLSLGQPAAVPSPSPSPTELPMSFRIEAEIGRALPRRMIYEPIYERYAVIDAYSRLLLIDARDYSTQAVLYEAGRFNDFAFSHDGRWLALAVERRIELWDAERAVKVASIDDPGQPIQVIGPLAFTRDNRFLQFSGVYPAPRSIRLFEGQTVNVPWVWDLAAARREAQSQYPNRAEAWQFFDYRNGFVLGPEDRIVAALPGRLQVLNPATLEVYFDIPTTRYEQEPMNVFFSARDSKIYVRPNNNSRLLIQVDALRGVLSEVPLERALRPQDLASLPVEVSASAAQRQGYRTPLMRLLLGGMEWGFPNNLFWGLIPRGLIPFQVTIIDYLTPPSGARDNILLLVRVDNPFTTESAFFLSLAVSQAVLSADGETLLLRHFVNRDERISAFDARSGQLDYRFTPSLRAIGGYSRSTRNRVLAYTRDGQQIISDFQRYSADQGQVVAEDLRYSRRFDRFFFTEDGQRVVTLSGTEWREWDANSGEVLRREVVNLSNLLTTSRDGYRFLSLRRQRSGRFEAFIEILDLNNGLRRTQTLGLEAVEGSFIENVAFNADWTRFLAIYSPNVYGPYGEGNQIAYYALGQGRLWHMAGDDLPPPYNREYRFVDAETVLVRGEGFANDQTARIFGVDYSTQGGLPACLVQRFPQQIERWSALWERLIARLRDDQLHRLALFICQQDLSNASAVQALLVLTATPLPVTRTPVVLPGVPVCLTFAYGERAEQVAALWRDITRDLDDNARAEMEALMCQGIGDIDAEVLLSSDEQYLVQTVLIGADGVRRSGDVPPPPPRPNLLEPLRREFYRATERDFGQAIPVSYTHLRAHET
jgi:hypothetical protein